MQKHSQPDCFRYGSISRQFVTALLKSFLRLKIVDECKMKAVFSYKFLSSLQVYRIDLTSRSLTSDTVSKISYPTLNSRVV